MKLPKKQNRLFSGKAKYFIFALAAVIVFTTVYALILPAIAIESSQTGEGTGLIMMQENAGEGENLDTEATIGQDDAAGQEIDGQADGQADPDGSLLNSQEPDSAEDPDNADASNGMEEPDSADDPQDEEDPDGKKADSEMPAMTFEAKIVKEGATATADGAYGVELSEKKPLTEAQKKEIIIQVKAEAEEGTFPAGTTMKIHEISSDANVKEKAENAVQGDAIMIQAVDISFHDPEGNEIEPLKEIKVTITSDTIKNLKNEQGTDPVIVHLPDQGKAEVINLIDEKKLESKPADDELVFESERFSAYAIVQGPSEYYNTSKISSLEELRSLGENGLYIGTTSGFFLTDQTSTVSGTRGIIKSKPARNSPSSYTDVKYFFVPVEGTEDQFYIYFEDADGNPRYIVNTGTNAHLDTTGNVETATAFSIVQDTDSRFRIHFGERYWNMWSGANGTIIAAWNQADDNNNYFYIWKDDEEAVSDPYELDGKTYGLMNWEDSVTGRALMSDSSSEGHLDALPLAVMAKAGNHNTKLYVPDDGDITFWTFHWAHDNYYYLSTVVGGATQYLKITSDGISLVSELDESCYNRVIPGTGKQSGEIALKSDSATLTYSGKVADGFSSNGSVGMEWLHLVEESELTSEYLMTYSAEKVSVSDPSITNGSRVIVYTRVWNDSKKRYDFYAIDHDGSLVPCYESGDSIEWTGTRLNTLLWNLVEYYWDDGTPNYYYELYNQYSGKYIAPQHSDGQILSDEVIGINLNGRRNMQYYSSIIAWDDEYYAYVGLKADIGASNATIASCKMSDADDFYFAIINDKPIDDDHDLDYVPTVDGTAHGITMKMVNFGTRTEMSNFLGSNTGGAVNTIDKNLLTTDLKSNGYPETKVGNDLSEWFAAAPEVNHLFVESTYNASGYFEFDATQNFAKLGADNNFVLYQEIGTTYLNGDPDANAPHYFHGQFFPYNDLQAGQYSNYFYTTTSGGQALPESDPRKYERLYLVEKPDYYMGMELEASFTQTPDGLDDWGHDIIYEFTGDDDFWLYVDGELIIDIGGIHNALSGTVNFRTGDVIVTASNGITTNLLNLFESNYRTRNPAATDAEVLNYLKEYFKPKDGVEEVTSKEDLQPVFKDYTNHTMKIFYLERGAGASNLHMRFNLASVKKGTVQLTKQLEGVDAIQSVFAEFPYQIIYRTEKPDGTLEEHYLTNAVPHDPIHNTNYVHYKDTTNPVKYETQVEIAGVPYQDVFFLNPDETVEISFPEGAVDYKIIECGINTQVYSNVNANGVDLPGTDVTHEGEIVPNRKDYGIDYATTDERARVNYINRVNPEALRILTLKKNVFDETGENPLHYPEEKATFDFRLYLATEFNNAIDNSPANMHTYHVKDHEGYYCRWDVPTQSFVSTGVSTYADFLNLDENIRDAATFTTSMNGAVSRIPVDFTVEIRDILAGTQFKVVERPTEIPDGYSFQKYIYKGVEYKETETESADTVAWNGVKDTVVVGDDPHVDVCNLKGWGLRVNKVWTDADFMVDRAPTYFAVFTTDEDGSNPTLVADPQTVMQMAYGQTTLYWYFLHLPVPVPFAQYQIREVTISNENPTVTDEGIVTDPGTVTIIPNGATVTLSGKQKGEESAASYQYTVSYDSGTPEDGSNVRVDTVTNSRPGLLIRKTVWDGVTPLSGAQFTMAVEDDEIGSFISDETGFVTTAFLGVDKDYILTENKTPKTPHPYRGLDEPLTISLSDGVYTVNGAEEYFVLEQGEGVATPTLTIKNRPYTFKAVKTDVDTAAPLSGVSFALHQQKTVDGVVIIEPDPMAGYENLVTDENGIIPKIDNTLAPGTYELREKAAPGGYEQLSGYIRFTVSETGVITLVPNHYPREVTLSSIEIDEDDPETTDINEEGMLSYVLTIPNHQLKKISFKKVDIGAPIESSIPGAEFDLYRVIDGVREDNPMYRNLVSGADGILSLNGQTEFELATGTYQLIETKAPAGYILKEEPITIIISAQEEDPSKHVIYDEGTTLSATGEGVIYNENTKVYTLLISNTSGVKLPDTGGIGTRWFYIVGTALLLIAAALIINKMFRKNHKKQ